MFGGGFLGLDNISPLDRSNLRGGARLEQADGTAWMAYYAMAMLVIAVDARRAEPVYEDMVVKFLEQFVQIGGPSRSRASTTRRTPSSTTGSPRRRAVEPCGCGPRGAHPAAPAGRRRPGRRRTRPPRKGFARPPGELGPARGHPADLVRELDGDDQQLLVSVGAPGRRPADPREFLDEDAFLSPHGLRSISKRYEGSPYRSPGMPGATIDYEPAESPPPCSAATPTGGGRCGCR